MPDGTICVGISPTTGKSMYTLPADAPLMMNWQQAMDYAGELDAHGHADWRLPTSAELQILYDNRERGELKNTFNSKASYVDPSWYWSSTEDPEWPNLAWTERFSTGYRNWDWKVFRASVRPVRSEPRP